MNGKHVFVCCFLLFLLAACRTSRVSVKTTEKTNEESVIADSGSTKRTYVYDGERQSQSFCDEWENMELTQVHERDSAGNEKTTTAISINRNRRQGAAASKKESTAQQTDSSAVRKEETSRNRQADSDRNEVKEPPPAVSGYGFWIKCLTALFIIIGIFTIIWPEPVRQLGRLVWKMIKTVLNVWLRQ